MRRWMGIGLVATLAHSLVAQEFHSTRTSIEASFGVADLKESYTSDCCGPSRTLDGVSFSLRFAHPLKGPAEAGGQFGATLADGSSMEWLMATGALAGPWRLSPWLELGAGAIGHPGDCPLLVTAAT